MLHNNYDNSQAFSESNDLKKLLFHGQEYLRAAAPSGPLSYVEPAVNRQPGFRRELVEQTTF